MVSLPNVQVVLEQGTRHRWASATADVRALENPTQTLRRSATCYDAAEVRLRLDFSAAYSGTLHLYGVELGQHQPATDSYRR